MAIHKKEEFSQKEQDLAAFAKALSHPARIAILKVRKKMNASAENLLKCCRWRRVRLANI
jgi:DNA-binding transcriptional ArsR family regulator